MILREKMLWEILIMKHVRVLTTVIVLFILSVYSMGCGDKFWDPTQVGRFRPVPAVNVILDSLGVAEEAPPAWETGEEPKPVDVMVYDTDYKFGRGDVVRVSIFELLTEGAQFINDYSITETGKLSIPEVGTIDAEGLTESQLEEEIKQILSPNILKEPSVAVTLMNSEQRMFSIQGNGVPRPSRYSIPRYDFRLLDALATAGGIGQFNISYVYVTRSVTGKEAVSQPAEPTQQPAEPKQKAAEPAPEQIIKPENEMMEIIAPRAQRQLPNDRIIITSSEMVTDKELAVMASPEELGMPEDSNVGRAGQADTETAEQKVIINKPINSQEIGRIEWVFQDGKWMPVQVGQPVQTKPVEKINPDKPLEPLKEKELAGLDWNQIEQGGVQTRVIKIPSDKLLGGDSKYNIVVRPGDNIHVPVDIIGEFYIMGNTNNQGFINLTGRPMTLKMAIASAGGLGPLAWPKRCEVTRRISKTKEETVMVDLDKIANGEQPDFFIKPNDLINVGTHPAARWLAVLRNAFRATYGFGFIYDRNFADRDYGTSRPIPGFISSIF
jgi:polysaccharide biosynthesis/export protein